MSSSPSVVITQNGW